MSKKVELAVQGRDAIGATRELLEMPEMKATWVRDPEAEREAGQATNITIAGITGLNLLAVAERIVEWYQKADGENRIQSVEIRDTEGNRYNLEEVSAEEVKAMLENL